MSRDMQCGEVIDCDVIDGRALCQEYFGRLHVFALHGHVERSQSILSLAGDRRTVLQQPRHYIAVSGSRRAM